MIDFAASLHGLGKRDAAVRLAEDFSIPYDLSAHRQQRTPPKPTPEQRLRQAEQHCFKVLCDYLHLLERWKIEYAPQPQDAAWHPLFVEALQKNSYVEYLLDILLFGEMEEKAALIAEQGKEVVRLEQRISELTASSAGSSYADDGRNGTGADAGRNPGNAGGDAERRREEQHQERLTVFQRDPLLRGAVSYNILSERVDIVKPLGWERTSATDDRYGYEIFALYLEEHYGLTSEKKVENAIQIVANENRYHPVRDYLNSLQWDGTERIRYALHHFLGADTDEYTFEALKLFMMGAIRRVFQPGSKFEVMLCLVGGQGAGKSTFFRLLAVKDEWFSDDLKKLDDENVYRKLQGHWIMEMSEMIATANAKY